MRTKQISIDIIFDEREMQKLEEGVNDMRTCGVEGCEEWRIEDEIRRIVHSYLSPFGRNADTGTHGRP